jgi:hypothetical protein
MTSMGRQLRCIYRSMGESDHAHNGGLIQRALAQFEGSNYSNTECNFNSRHLLLMLALSVILSSESGLCQVVAILLTLELGVILLGIV